VEESAEVERGLSKGAKGIPRVKCRSFVEKGNGIIIGVSARLLPSAPRVCFPIPKHDKSYSFELSTVSYLVSHCADILCVSIDHILVSAQTWRFPTRSPFIELTKLQATG
jgi:hypothetical protein